MDIVSSLPFTLKLIQEYPMYRETSALNFLWMRKKYG